MATVGNIAVLVEKYLYSRRANINFAAQQSPQGNSYTQMKDLKTAPRSNLATVLAHTIFIIMLFVLPELVMTIAHPHRSQWGLYPGFYTKAAVCLAVFYLNYFVLVDRELVRDRPRIWRFVLINTGVVAVALFTTRTLDSLMFEFPRPRHWEDLTELQKIARTVSFLLRDAVMLVLAIGLAVAMRLSTRWTDVQLQRQRLLSAQRESELESLKSQLNPHFLFNTLNSIYALIDINSDDAREAVHKLSGMLRYMLYENRPTVSLEQESQFLADYIALMQLRLRACAHPLEVELPDPHAVSNLKVPPLIFIPLVENALKYGLEGNAGAAVKISLRVEDDAIVMHTENSYTHGSANHRDGGIGLANLRRRLTLIYGDRARLRTSLVRDIFIADLSIPIATISNSKALLTAPS